MSQSDLFLHVVMMQFDDRVDARFHRQVKEHADRVRRECGGIVLYHYGENTADRSQGYTHATSALFTSAGAHDAYQTSPAHVAMKEFMMGHIQRIAVHDTAIPASEAGQPD
ncbi:Dabb family protein [uncultured Castellaniella sp.]|uniref:Dabb family protein n=1 Tax=uncultured Castellaniella sp. TaxID=647907 RepID=UPI00261A2F8C|nr:Dabb family protein [uncultured Castellaniella sp.]